MCLIHDCSSFEEQFQRSVDSEDSNFSREHMVKARIAFFVSLCFVGGRCSPDVRLVDEAGSLSSVGLLQVKTDAGFGSVCGANPAAADVICRSMGYDFGSVSSSPCGFYGGADLCGAAGSPVVSCLSMHEECARAFLYLVEI